MNGRATDARDPRSGTGVGPSRADTPGRRFSARGWRQAGVGCATIPPLSEDAVELVKDTAMEVAWHVWQARPPEPSLTVVVKATYTIVPEGECLLADEQALPTGDMNHDDDAERSLRYASDLDPLKPRGECMVVGSFHAPGGRPVKQSKIAFQIGPVGKQLAVFGDRAWHLGRPSDARPISHLPLSWESAFGGPEIADNPVGRGLTTVEIEGRSFVLLPNLEDPMRLIGARDQRPPPVGVGPVPRSWPSRMRLAGTYDAQWQRTRYPWFPEDLDWRFFNAAPADQQIDGWWRGDETIALLNLHPAHASVRCRLPGLRAHAFLVPSGGRRPHDVGLALDTITVDADAGQILLHLARRDRGGEGGPLGHRAPLRDPPGARRLARRGPLRGALSRRARRAGRGGAERGGDPSSPGRAPGERAPRRGRSRREVGPPRSGHDPPRRRRRAAERAPGGHGREGRPELAGAGVHRCPGRRRARVGRA